MYAWWVCNVTVSLTMSVLIGRHSISWFALELIHESELSLVKYHARIPGKGYNYILVPFHGWIKASETCETLNYFELSFAQPSPIHSFINNSTVLARANNRRTLLESCSQHCAPEAECRLLCWKFCSGFTSSKNNNNKNRRTLLESSSQHCAHRRPNVGCGLLMIPENFVLG